ncbi:MAG: alpha/beta hydrolase [Bacteroidota bacterium]|nr:alpha/beta hydrolase [Bacteroidota bacterium]
MKFLSVFIITCLLNLSAGAQNLTGITGIPDTSYTNYSAFRSSRKTRPDIRLVSELQNSSVGKKMSLVYTRYGDRRMLMDVFYPTQKSRNNHIAILIIHGGGWRSGNRSQHYALASYLANLGYACFTPEYRLSTEALFPAAVYDLKAAIRWIRKEAANYAIDTSRIAALGFSAGGELAAFLGVTGNLPLFEGTSGIVKGKTNVGAVIDMDGILSFVHPESGEGDDRKNTSAATYWLGYPKKGNEHLWEAASSLSYVSPFTPPTLFINSSVSRMHAGRDDYRALLTAYGIYSEVKTFPDAPHSFPQFEPWFSPGVQYIDQFLQKVFAK